MSHNYKSERVRTARRITTAAMSLLLLCIAIEGCRARGQERVAENLRVSRKEAYEIAVAFLTAASRPDSLSLAAVASDSVVAEVLTLHRAAAAQHVQAARGAFDNRSAQATMYADGSDIVFPYNYEGRRYRAGLRISRVSDKLRVESFGIPVIID
ncbi:MAG TPA: hypothetical protein VGB24_20655 [Longimicrobium sp.]|jgi:hypothetical protein|uniref:hypothetical protein n=1 Tax=Longimicrobium sp. TaxID=2029185 RepID=UPI002EDBABB2